jgi:hypothetical protein
MSSFVTSRRRDTRWSTRSKPWCWQLFEAPSGSWPARLDGLDWTCYPELTLATEGGWSPAHAKEPAFGAGVSVDSRLRDELGARDDWLQEVMSAGFDAVPFDEMLRIYRTKSLAEVVDAGATLSKQASFLANWAERAITDALQLDPGDLGPRRKKGGRKSAAQQRE